MIEYEYVLSNTDYTGRSIRICVKFLSDYYIGPTFGKVSV